jgi:endonuclease III
MSPRKKLTREERRIRAARILASLDRSYPDARCALQHGSAFELLIATMLSAQCTDERVNRVTPDLFRKYRAPADFAAAPQAQLEGEIHSTGFFRNKARNIQAACRMIMERFSGRMPETMAQLIELPGVARKTANVVLGVVFGKAEGIVVDTHVFRVSRRLELASAETPEKV